MRINHNMMAMNTQRQLGANNDNYSKSLEKLSSGLRINRAGDDAAGLAISEKMRGQIRGLNQGSRNAQDSISLIQTAEGSLNETHDILQRVRELAVQSSNDTNTDSDRTEIQAEVKQLLTEVDRIGNTTEFNTKKLLDGSAKGVSEQVDGSFALNNNSRLTIDGATVTAINTTAENSSKLNGAIMLVRTGGTSAGTAGSGTFNAAEYKIVLSNGAAMAGGSAAQTGVTLTNAAITFAASGTASSGLGGAGAVNFTGGMTLTNMKVGESVTFVFGKVEAAGTTMGSSIMTQIGANAGQTALISMKDMRSSALGIEKIDVTTKFGAQTAIETVNNALQKVSHQRSSLGAIQNRLEHTIKNLDAAGENLQASESRVRDVDMAKEMMASTKNKILASAAQAMLAQANQAPEGVLQLLR